MAVENVYQSLILQKFAPPCLLVNLKEEILLVNGETEKYLSSSYIKPGQLLSDIVDENIYNELLKGLREVVQGEESVFIDGRSFHERYKFYIYLTPVASKAPHESLVLIEFEDIYPKNINLPANRYTNVDLQPHFDELLMATDHDLKNLVSNFIMLLKFDAAHYSNESKINDIDKLRTRILANFHLNLNKLAHRIYHYFKKAD